MFPGTNCETETARAIREAGFDSQIFRWNDSPEKISASDGLVIAGGFSFEDRGRSGVIAASDPVSDIIRKMAHEGKPILGICNGAQVLVETGLVPGYYVGEIEMSLARNRRQNKEGILGSGFYHDFIFLSIGQNKCAWTMFDGVIRLPIAHGEGRFFANDDVIAAIQANGQNVMTYCDEKGNIDPHFPVNPNGSLLNAAAICNPDGNVMAMMPHPERIEGGQKVFQSLHAFFEKGLSRKISQTPSAPVYSAFLKKKDYLIELYVSLKITDNTEKTLETAAQKIFSLPNLSLSRQVFWGIESDGNPKEVALSLIESEQFLNENKEEALCKIGSDWYEVQNAKLKPISPPSEPVLALLSSERDDVLGEEKQESLMKHSGLSVKISSGVLWGFSENVPEEQIAQSALFGNPISWKILKV